MADRDTQYVTRRDLLSPGDLQAYPLAQSPPTQPRIHPSVTDLALSMSKAHEVDRTWAAQLMSTSEPWLSLSLGFDDCLATTEPAEDTQLLVACDDDTPCGFVLLRPRGLAGSPYIVSIAVEESYRGRGIGSWMLAHVEARSRSDARHIFLCVSSFNSSARRLYERHGYRAVGELPDYVIDGASEVLMLKRLT